jgi:hypothetical protein
VTAVMAAPVLGLLLTRDDAWVDVVAAAGDDVYAVADGVVEGEPGRVRVLAADGTRWTVEGVTPTTTGSVSVGQRIGSVVRGPVVTVTAQDRDGRAIAVRPLLTGLPDPAACALDAPGPDPDDLDEPLADGAVP